MDQSLVLLLCTCRICIMYHEHNIVLFKGLGLQLDGVPWPINKFLHIVAVVVCLVKRRKIIGKEGYQPN